VKKNTSILLWLCIAGLVIAFSSCATIKQKVTIAPINMDYPVSASKTLIVDDKVIQAESMKIIKPFQFTTKLTPKIKEKTASLDLSQNLVALIKENDGNAITQLKIKVTNINTRSVDWISFERGTGISLLALTGGLVALMAQAGNGSSAVGVTSVVGGAGALFLGGSFLHEAVGTAGYTIDISGNVVKY
jgi:hypothetical protein